MSAPLLMCALSHDVLEEAMLNTEARCCTLTGELGHDGLSQLYFSRNVHIHFERGKRGDQSDFIILIIV